MRLLSHPTIIVVFQVLIASYVQEMLYVDVLKDFDYCDLLLWIVCNEDITYRY